MTEVTANIKQRLILGRGVTAQADDQLTLSEFRIAVFPGRPYGLGKPDNTTRKRFNSIHR